MKYSEDQLRDYAMRVAWQTLDDETRKQMLDYARASLKVAEEMGAFWDLLRQQGDEEAM